ncbi:hypothetical protein XYCOK13_02610 [Xylanibacillus composti]|uniref:Uncharacterized protein n=1 Tax=Xylanibacillus composti TaxID=1572762 RepID=A0A8J4H102_9BACL|nr:hypothetical protein XYCOK13_02610 [Xylanibacillus composti]
MTLFPWYIGIVLNEVDRLSPPVAAPKGAAISFLTDQEFAVHFKKVGSVIKLYSFIIMGFDDSAIIKNSAVLPDDHRNLEKDCVIEVGWGFEDIAFLYYLLTLISKLSD